MTLRDLAAHESPHGHLLNDPAQRADPEDRCLICNRELTPDEDTCCTDCLSDEEA